MKQYKGYYIDNVIFHNEAEIDDMLKRKDIEGYQRLCRMFAEDPCVELIAMMTPYEHRLHNEHGLSYGEIELLEIEAYA